MLLDYLIQYRDSLFLWAVILYAFVEAMVDAYAQMSNTYSRRQTLSHRWGWIGRAFVVTGASMLMYGFSFKMLLMLFNAGVLFWSYFELFLNRKKGLKQNYVGKTAFWDRQFRKLTAWLVRKTGRAIKPNIVVDCIKFIAFGATIVLNYCYL